jgi:hypothetical protein
MLNILLQRILIGVDCIADRPGPAADNANAALAMASNTGSAELEDLLSWINSKPYTNG